MNKTVYVASSWRNLHHPSVVKAIQEAGYNVYDFRNPIPGNYGFSWRECGTEEELKDPSVYRDKILESEPAKRGFAYDMSALQRAYATVLVLPCGRSAHLELGYAVGMRQRTIVLLDTPLSEPELMYKMVDRICVNMSEVLGALR